MCTLILALGQGHSPCIRICICTFTSGDVDADAGKCPTQPGITQSRLKKFPEGAKLPAFPRFMQGACYQLKTDNFGFFLEIIGCGLTG
jgi:hypothetical protein